MSERCRIGECSADRSSVDVYCRDPRHGDLLLLRDWPSGRMRWWAVNALRTAVVGLVVLSAGLEAVWPIYLLATAVGAGCIGLLLHAHPFAQAVGIAGWLVSMMVAWSLAAVSVDGDARRVVVTVIVGLPVALGAILGVLVIRYVTRDLVDGVLREATGAVGASVVTAAVLILVWWATIGPLADRFVEVPEGVSRWFLVSGLGSVLSGMLAAAIGGLLLSRRVLDRHVRPWIENEPDQRRVNWAYSRELVEAPSRQDLGTQLVWRLTLFGQRLSRSMVRLARQAVNGLLAVEAAARRALRRGANAVHRRLVLVGRRVVFVLTRGRRILLAGTLASVQASGYSAGPIGAYVAAIGGSLAALHLASSYTEYLVDGSVLGLAAGAAWSVAGLALGAVMVERLATVPTREVVRSVERFVSNAAPDVAIFVVISGWVVGVPGTFGYGPIRVGWVTGVGTLVLMVLMVPVWLQGRRNRDAPVTASAGAPSQPQASSGGY